MPKVNETIQFKIRITEGLRRQSEREAKKTGRTANAEAVARLEASFERVQTEETIKIVTKEAFAEIIKSAWEAGVDTELWLKKLRGEAPASGQIIGTNQVEDSNRVEK